MWITDPKTGKKSVTVTMLVVGYAVALTKLLFADTNIGGFNLGAFSGSDFATVVGALGSIYGFRKFTDRVGDGKDS